MSLDLNHNSGPLGGPKSSAVSQSFDVAEQVNVLIDAGLAQAAAKEPKRTYLGASMLGDPCLRKLVYHYRGIQQKEPEGRMRRIWARGHAAEVRIIDWLRRAGFTVVDRNRSGRQFEFSQADGRIAGHIDGAVTAGPAPLPYPMLLELKCLNNKSWNDLRKNGLAKSKVIYNAQVHLYMGYLELSNCLFGAENADTEELWWYVIPYDLAEAQRVSDRAVEVLRSSAGPLPRRIANAPDFYLCRMCGFAETCWSDAA